MTAKKKTDEVSGQSLEPVITTLKPEPTPKPKEKLIAVTPIEWFSDGNLQDFMAQYGYPCEWPARETRNLPRWLVQRCINSGAEFEELS